MQAAPWSDVKSREWCTSPTPGPVRRRHRWDGRGEARSGGRVIGKRTTTWGVLDGRIAAAASGGGGPTALLVGVPSLSFLSLFFPALLSFTSSYEGQHGRLRSVRDSRPKVGSSSAPPPSTSFVSWRRTWCHERRPQEARPASGAVVPSCSPMPRPPFGSWERTMSFFCSDGMRDGGERCGCAK